MAKPRRPELSPYWKSLEHFASQEVALAGMFASVTAGLKCDHREVRLLSPTAPANGRRFVKQYEAVPVGTPWRATAPTPSEVTLKESWTILSETEYTAGRYFVKYSLHVAHPAADEYVLYRPGLRIAPDSMQPAGFADVTELLCSPFGELQATQDVYRGWLARVSSACAAMNDGSAHFLGGNA